MKTSLDVCIWVEEFDYNGSIERVKEDFLNQLYLKSHMQGDALILKGFVTVKEMDWHEAITSTLSPAARRDKFLQDIHSLATSGILSDFTFIVDGAELQVHKAILAGEQSFVFPLYRLMPRNFSFSARSPVFERMFTGSFREATASKQEILDISADTFEEFLYFIYAGDIRNKDFSVQELFSVADRYQVADLIKVCEMKLLTSVNDDNAEAIYRLANRIECNTELKKVSFDILQS